MQSIELPFVVIKHDAAALVAPFFGDIGLAEDLDAAGQRRDDLAGIILEMGKHAILAESHLEAILHGFDMDVAGVILDGPEDDGVDRADHGGGVYGQGMAGLFFGKQIQGFADGAALGDDRYDLLA